MIYGSGAGAEVCLVAFVLLGIRALAIRDDEDTVPVFVLGAAIGAAVLRWALVGTFPFDEETLQPAPRCCPRITLDWLPSHRWRASAWSCWPSVQPAGWCACRSSPASPGSRRRRGLPTGSGTVPDPPDARAGFTGAALLIAACLAGDVYLATTRAWQPLLEALSALGHLVAYLAVLRSIGRIGERLGDEDVVRRARALGWLAALAVGAATIGGFVLRRSAADLALEIAVPIAVACVAFGVLVPCALLIREVAALVGRRFRPLPRAETRASLE